MSWHGNSGDNGNSHSSLPLPPTPPQRRQQNSAVPSYGEDEEVKLAPLGEESESNADGAAEADILVNLQALQREVDELRGKYEAKAVDARP